MWQPCTVMRRRRIDSEATFPGWSWGGWIGQVGYEETVDLRFERIIPLVK